MATKNVTPVRSIGRSLNFATGRMNALCAKRLEPHDLTLPQWVVLSCIWRDGPLRITTISNMMRSGVPATSRIVARMQERGLLYRKPSGDDGRVSVVDVTKAGQALDHLSDFHEQINDALFDGFSASEKSLAFDMLERLRSNAETALETDMTDTGR